MEMIDPRLIKKSKEIKSKEKEEKLNPYLDLAQMNGQPLIYTANSLADALPNISYKRVQKLIDEGKIRTIPAGVFGRWPTIPINTLLEDLQKLVEQYN